MNANGTITMAMRELDRSKVMQLVVDGMLKPWRAALRLDLTTLQAAAQRAPDQPVVTALRMQRPGGFGIG